MSRPMAAEGLLDAVAKAVPERVRKRLAGGNPAEAWTWSTSEAGGTVTTEGGETVTLGAAPVTVEALSCSCLLGPRCLHVLAVAAALPSPVVAQVTEVPAPPEGPPRPAAAPGLLEAVAAAVPERVRKRLGEPNPADAWTWERGAEGWTVRTDGGDLVRITAEPVAAVALACSCLLGPKCLHVLAVAAAIERPSRTTAAHAATPEPPPPPPEEKVPLDGGQRAVVAATTRAAWAVLHAGATGVGDTAREDLRRAAHACRAVGLHRLARAATRVLRQVADLQGRRPSFTLAALTEDLQELLLVAHELGQGAAPRAAFGTARRTYAPVGSLRLYGLCTEPVVSAGFGGTSTLLCDAQGRLWTVSDVMPTAPGGTSGPGQDAARARATYDAPASVGGATLPHRQLGRHGLFVQDATASDEGRLGSGAGVKAVRAGPSTWDDEGPARRFAEPADQQLGRAIRGGEAWLFLTATVLGADEVGLVLGVDGLRRPLRAVPAHDHTELAFRDDLRLVARAPGLRLRVIARHVPRPRTIAAIAIGPAPAAGDPSDLALALPGDWGGRCNLGYDRLVAAHVPGLQRDPVEAPWAEEEDVDPLIALRRRVERMALGGRGTLPGDVRGVVEREAAGLRARHLPTAAAALLALAEAAPSAPTDRLARAWLSAALVDRVTSRAILARAG